MTLVTDWVLGDGVRPAKRSTGIKDLFYGWCRQCRSTPSPLVEYSPEIQAEIVWDEMRWCDGADGQTLKLIPCGWFSSRILRSRSERS